MGDRLLYLFPSGLPGADLACVSSPISCDNDVSVLINEELTDSIYGYYSKENSTEGEIWGRVLSVKAQNGDLNFLGNISTTCLIPPEYSLYL